MHFSHTPEIWGAFPQLAVGAIVLRGVTSDVSVAPATAPFYERASSRVGRMPASELPEIRAWRQAFSKMGLKPTQYRCASEALLRRFTRDGSLPAIHPLVDACNAVSVAFAIPIAVFDLSCVSGDLKVGHATGDENYLAFSGEIEHPASGEVIFADDAGQAHARRWTNKQSAVSAIHPETRSVLIVAEALHPTAVADIAALVNELAQLLDAHWNTPSLVMQLNAEAPLLTIPRDNAR